MVHLTNDYRKLLRRNGPKAALSLCVALALSGGLVSAEGKTYDDVSPGGSREALEGDPIEVEWMRGGEGTLRAGTDETGNVLIHHLKTWGNPDTYAYVKGKKITIEDRDPNDPTANWGGKMYIGGDTTESVTMKGLHAGNQSETTIYGRTISMGTLGTGNGQFTIGNKNTESVTINDFGAAEGSSTIINGHSVSMGSLNNWGGTVTVKTNGDFKVAKDGNFQTIGLTDGGTISVTAGSMEAGGLTVSDNNSEADIHITGEKGLHFSNSIHTGEHVKINIDSPVIRIDGNNKSWLGNSMDTTNSTVILGNDSSQITMNGRLFNAGSNVTLMGKTIHLNAFLTGSNNVNAIENTNGGYNPSGTIIGNEKTENVYVDGKTIVSSSNITLSMAGRNISLSYPKGIALVGGGGKAYIGQKETENLTIAGQVSNQSAETMQLSGEHIIIDSTEYGGPKNGVQFPESLLAYHNDIDAGTEHTKAIYISGGLRALYGDIHVLGQDITVGTSDYFIHGAESKSGPSQTGYIALATEKDINIGDKNSDIVQLHGGQILAQGGNINVQGKNIVAEASDAYISPVHVKVVSGDTVLEDYQRVSMIGALGANVDIGSDDSESIALQGGTLLADGAYYDNNYHPSYIKVLGKNISIDGKQQWAGETNAGQLIFGSESSDQVSIQGKGGIHARGGRADILGKWISIQSDTENALENNGAPIVVGSPDTQSIHVSGGIVSHGS